MTTNTYGGYTVDQLREFIRHHYDAEHGGDNIDELRNDSSASVKIVRDLLDAIEPQQDGDLLRPIARWVYNAVRVNLDLLHGICSEFGCQQGEDVATWLRARLAGVPTPCMCSGVGPREQRTDGSCRRDRAAVPAQAAGPVAYVCSASNDFAPIVRDKGAAQRLSDAHGDGKIVPLYAAPQPAQADAPAEAREPHTYASTQATNCASCGEHKHTPLRIDWMGGYVCLTCIDRELESRAPADAGEAVVVAYRVLRRNTVSGEWVSDGRHWCDGAPSADLLAETAGRADEWRVEIAAPPTARVANLTNSQREVIEFAAKTMEERMLDAHARVLRALLKGADHDQ
ncbi:hypothetical protein [Burkholderia sp. BDU5]|uniref:hypothetical protein n=1 Tax=Burkholderia sp. BDU5 TaxID=1385590 RepID=UPI000AEACE0D|nr:hypothetical protein [Burkholderia sp. BDU5]